MNNFPHSHVRIDEFTQTGATLLLIQYSREALKFTKSRVPELHLLNMNLVVGKTKRFPGQQSSYTSTQAIWKNGEMSWQQRQHSIANPGKSQIGKKCHIRSQSSVSSPQVLSHMSTSLERLFPLFR